MRALRTVAFLALALVLALGWWIDQKINGLGAGEVND